MKTAPSSGSAHCTWADLGRLRETASADSILEIISAESLRDRTHFFNCPDVDYCLNK